MSAVLKNLREGTGFDKPAKLPASLKGMCPEQMVALLIQTYRTAVEQRGIAYIDITNAEAGRNIIDVVNWMYKTPAYRSTLFLQGTVGSGKSTILRALHALYSTLKESTRLCTAKDICNQYRRLRDDDPNLYEGYKTILTLFLDELGTEPVKFLYYGAEYTPIHDLIDYHYNRQLTTIITTNLSMDQLNERYGQRIRDRFDEMCSVIQFSAPSYRGQVSPPAE